MIDWIRTLVRGEDERVLYECRHCGAAVDAAAARCPSCGASEIARFTL